jgi:hypothetical protein
VQGDGWFYPPRHPVSYGNIYIRLGNLDYDAHGLGLGGLLCDYDLQKSGMW